MSERRVGERLERLVQVRQLVRDPDEGLGGIGPPVQGVDFGVQPVEPLEDRVELAVVEVLSMLHGSKGTVRRRDDGA